MEKLWTSLLQKKETGTLCKKEDLLYKKMGKAMVLLSRDPRYPGLASHEIDALSKRYGIKVWQSYLENKTSKAGRIFWIYGPGKQEITIIGLEPHPEDKKKSGYTKVTLSASGKVEL
ncbi:hypothetical protein [uncultured Sphaerochaeta sp.]|uniref:hypothetical protein n=1 Tax=uncultured Sphaerochaeta sp. TaxID=886478 RepID=UPI002A0A57A0|nr:hypothetical protein [uncultured Sphaerochaeta sp.]